MEENLLSPQGKVLEVERLDESEVLAGEGAFEKVQIFNNSSNPSGTYTSGCTVRGGYRELSGTINGGGSYLLFYLWEVPISTCVSVTATLCASDAGASGLFRFLNVFVGRDTTNQCFYIGVVNTYHNFDSTYNANLNGLKVYYTAVFRP